MCLPPTHLLPAAHTYFVHHHHHHAVRKFIGAVNATNSGLRQVDEDGCGPLAAVKSDAVLHAAGAAGPAAHLPLEDNTHPAAHQSAAGEGKSCSLASRTTSPAALTVPSRRMRHQIKAPFCLVYPPPPSSTPLIQDMRLRRGCCATGRTGTGAETAFQQRRIWYNRRESYSTVRLIYISGMRDSRLSLVIGKTQQCHRNVARTL